MSPNQPPFNPSQNTDLILQNLVVALGALNKTMASLLVAVQSTAPAATAGGATLPANPAGFVTSSLPNGTPIRVPFYNP